MMSYKLYVLVLVALLTSCITIEKDVEIVGEVSWDYWKQNAGWSDYSADGLDLDSDRVVRLKNLLKTGDYSFIVFATAFCPECEEELPKAFRIFEEAGVPAGRIRLIGLDKNGEEPSGLYRQYNAETVPIVIVLSRGTEIGRTEGVFTGLVDYLLKILGNR